MFKDYDLKGQIAMITGAGSGIGREVSRVLAEEGAVLALVDINEAGLKKTAGLLRQTNSDCEIFKADVSDYNSITQVFKKIENRF